MQSPVLLTRTREQTPLLLHFQSIIGLVLQEFSFSKNHHDGLEIFFTFYAVRSGKNQRPALVPRVVNQYTPEQV